MKAWNLKKNQLLKEVQGNKNITEWEFSNITNKLLKKKRSKAKRSKIRQIKKKVNHKIKKRFLKLLKNLKISKRKRSLEAVLLLLKLIMEKDQKLSILKTKNRNLCQNPKIAIKKVNLKIFLTQLLIFLIKKHYWMIWLTRDRFSKNQLSLEDKI